MVDYYSSFSTNIDDSNITNNYEISYKIFRILSDSITINPSFDHEGSFNVLTELPYSFPLILPNNCCVRYTLCKIVITVKKLSTNTNTPVFFGIHCD